MNLVAADHHNRQTQGRQLINHGREPNPTLLMRQECFITTHPSALTTTQKANPQRSSQIIPPGFEISSQDIAQTVATATKSSQTSLLINSISKKDVLVNTNIN